MKPHPLLVSFPLLASALMAGCAHPVPPPAGTAPAPAASPPPAALCDAGPAQSAVGQMATASVMESARVRSGAQMARVLRPGQIITKEFNAQRLNLEVDANGRILAVRCG
ncbi:MAG: proteinase inhibitor I78 [Acidovorax sp.]|uniref:I78 family peptidase inhibitor n=1 Tax=Acidovorax sp. TaxID=1872122 RepID=UPI0025C5E879|nr:I78 family peptidase inhibitor [Acidovorax sp.]MCE1193291.1 proteinase inhibitor I78 [Acidovorax sp.]